MMHVEWWIGAWKKDTVGLSLAQRGAYFELCMEIYTHEEPLAAEPREGLYRVAGAYSELEREAVDSIIDNPRYFELREGRLHQPRALKEIAKKQMKSGQRSLAAKVRWGAAPRPPRAKANGGWWKSDDGITAEAARRGLTTIPGESYEHLKKRIFALDESPGTVAPMGAVKPARLACRYCDKDSIGKVGIIPYCREHMDKALDGDAT